MSTPSTEQPLTVAGLTPAQIAILIALVDRQASMREQMTQATVRVVLTLLRTFNGHYSDDQVYGLARRISQVTRIGQRQTMTLTAAYLRQAIVLLGDQPPSRVPDLTVPETFREGDVSPEQVFERPIKEYRYQRSLDKPEEEARAISERRAEIIVEDEMILAMREATNRTLAPAENVQGWRRVIHPELSRGGSCGLCIAASDRIYDRIDAFQMHERCKCEVLPIVNGVDPGQHLNDADLAALYSAAGGSTLREDIAKVRAKVVKHGELGPVLRYRDQKFRDEEEAENDLAPRQAPEEAA